MAGDLMPHTVYIHAKGKALKEHLQESLMKGAQFDVDERMTKAEAEWKALCEGPKGVFDHEIDIEYDGADEMMLSADSLEKLTGWCMEQDWQVKVRSAPGLESTVFVSCHPLPLLAPLLTFLLLVYCPPLLSFSSLHRPEPPKNDLRSSPCIPPVYKQSHQSTVKLAPNPCCRRLPPLQPSSKPQTCL